MVNDKQNNNLENHDEESAKVDAIKDQFGNMLSGVERTLAVTCESIMGKMKQLEEKIQDMEKRYKDLAKDAENAIKEASTSDDEKKKTADLKQE